MHGLLGAERVLLKKQHMRGMLKASRSQPSSDAIILRPVADSLNDAVSKLFESRCNITVFLHGSLLDSFSI